MEVRILEEAGWNPAMYGLALSRHAKVEDMPRRARKLAFKGLGHNKVLEHLEIWMTVRAPRYWWQEADTYRLSTKQSESSMDNILKRAIVRSDFLYDIPGFYLDHLNYLRDLALNHKGEFIFVEKLKNALPEGYIQEREWKMSYKTLQNMLAQRRTHRLKEWRTFYDEILRQIAHPELLDPHIASFHETAENCFPSFMKVVVVDKHPLESEMQPGIAYAVRGLGPHDATMKFMSASGAVFCAKGFLPKEGEFEEVKAERRGNQSPPATEGQPPAEKGSFSMGYKVSAFVCPSCGHGK